MRRETVSCTHCKRSCTYPSGSSGDISVVTTGAVIEVSEGEEDEEGELDSFSSC